jgi:hypothetical protein
LACTQVAFGGVWAIAQEDQKQKQKQKPKRKQKLEVVRSPVAVRLAGGSDLTDANAGKPDCYRGLCPPPNL